ncbi:MAG: hypothetical protein RR954_04565 [Christensenellaceae bacterium]
MKKIVKNILLSVVALICIALMFGCGTAKDSSQHTEEMLNNGMKAGANVSYSIDEQGNRSYSYTNRDGSGGGGIEID